MEEKVCRDTCKTLGLPPPMDRVVMMTILQRPRYLGPGSWYLGRGTWTLQGLGGGREAEAENHEVDKCLKSLRPLLLPILSVPSSMNLSTGGLIMVAVGQMPETEVATFASCLAVILQLLKGVTYENLPIKKDSRVGVHLSHKELHKTINFIKTLTDLMQGSFPNNSIINCMILEDKKVKHCLGPVDVEIIDIEIYKETCSSMETFSCRVCSKNLDSQFHMRLHVRSAHFKEVVPCKTEGCDKQVAVRSKGGVEPHSSHIEVADDEV